MKTIVLLLFSFLFFYIPAQSHTYFVSPTGSNVPGAGTTAASPFLTILYAINAASPSDTIYLTGGTYTEAGININKSLTLVGEGHVVIDAAGLADNYILTVANTSNVIIDGITFENLIGNGSKGIWITNDLSSSVVSNNITIKNCTVTNVGWIDNDIVSVASSAAIAAIAIKVEGGNALALSDVSILNDTVYNCATGYSEAMEFTGNVDSFKVDGNLVYDIPNPGIDIAGHYTTTAPQALNKVRNGIVSNNTVHNCMSPLAVSAGIYLDGSQNVIVTRNRTYNNGAGISLGGEQQTTDSFGNFIVSDNLIYNNVVTGIFIGAGVNNVSIPLQNIHVYNNTFYKNRTGAIINGITTINGASISSLSDIYGGEIELKNVNYIDLENNIIYSSNDKREIVALYNYQIDNYSSDHNLFHNDNGNILIDIGDSVISFNGHTDWGGSYSGLESLNDVTGLETNSITGYPAFVDTANSNFNISPSSLAIGINQSYSSLYSGNVDYAGNPRLSGNAIDAGAYEFQNNTNSVNTVPLKDYIVYPNPATDMINVMMQSSTDKLQLELFDVTGKQLLNIYIGKVGNGTIIPVSLHNLNKGIYFLKIQQGQKQKTEKITRL